MEVLTLGLGSSYSKTARLESNLIVERSSATSTADNNKQDKLELSNLGLLLAEASSLEDPTSSTQASVHAVSELSFTAETADVHRENQAALFIADPKQLSRYLDSVQSLGESARQEHFIKGIFDVTRAIVPDDLESGLQLPPKVVVDTPAPQKQSGVAIGESLSFSLAAHIDATYAASVNGAVSVEKTALVLSVGLKDGTLGEVQNQDDAIVEVPEQQAKEEHKEHESADALDAIIGQVLFADSGSVKGVGGSSGR